MKLDAFATTGSSPGTEERLDTDVIHGGLEPDPATGAILTPVHQSTTFVQEAVGIHKGYTYSRSANPTVAALERNLGAIESAPPALCFATGMAATSTLLLGTLRAGDHIVVSDVVYGGTVRLARKVMQRFGVQVSFVDTAAPDTVGAALRRGTRLVLIESPANPTLKITDIGAVAAAARAAGARLVVDNTFMTAVLQDAFGLGADVVLYSTTKYIEGHNATVGGALLTHDEDLLERLREIRGTLGTTQSPWEAWLTLRGLKTLPMRVRRHCRNAGRVAAWLEQHPGVRRVTYPGLGSFPQRELALRQQRGGGGMLTFEVHGGADAARAVMRSLRLCALAENLGAVESLVTHPASMTHAALTAAEREAVGIDDGLIRLSVGLEDPQDIVDDLARALDEAGCSARRRVQRTTGPGGER